MPHQLPKVTKKFIAYKVCTDNNDNKMLREIVTRKV